jgi:hypothetical protein
MQSPGHAGAKRPKTAPRSEKNGTQGPIRGDFNSPAPPEWVTLTQSLREKVPYNNPESPL